MAKFEEQLKKVEEKSALNKLIPVKNEIQPQEDLESKEEEIVDENEDNTINNPYLEAMQKTIEEGFDRYDKKINRDRFDDINDRVTVLLNKELHEKLNALTTGNRGLKSELINIAVNAVLVSGIAEQKANEYRKKKEQLAKLEKQMRKLKR